MYCPVCGSKNLDDARFCAGCGTQLPNTDDSGGYASLAPSAAAGTSAQAPNAVPSGATPASGYPSGAAQSISQSAPVGAMSSTGQNATPGMGFSPEYLASLQSGAPVQTQAAPMNISDTIKQAEQASAAYQNLVAQLYELIQQRRNGSISEEVYANTWRQLTSSQHNGDKAGKEALMNLARQLLNLKNNGTIAPSVFDAECRWIESNYPDGKLAILDVEMEDLQQRKNNGKISNEVFSVRMAELRKKRAEAANPGPPPNPNDTGSFGYAVLGFFVPLVGLILYLVWKQERPRDAHQAGVGALTGVITGVVLWLLYFIVLAAWTSSIVSSIPRYR